MISKALGKTFQESQRDCLEAADLDESHFLYTQAMPSCWHRMRPAHVCDSLKEVHSSQVRT